MGSYRRLQTPTIRSSIVHLVTITWDVCRKLEPGARLAVAILRMVHLSNPIVMMSGKTQLAALIVPGPTRQPKVPASLTIGTQTSHMTTKAISWVVLMLAMVMMPEGAKMHLWLMY